MMHIFTYFPCFVVETAKSQFNHVYKSLGFWTASTTAAHEVMLQSSRPKETIQSELEVLWLSAQGRLWSCHHDHVQHGPKPLVSFLGFPIWADLWASNFWDMAMGQNPQTWPTELQLLQLQLLQAFLQDESGPFTTWLCVTCLGYPWLKSSWREQLGSMPIYGCAYSLRWPKKLLRVSHQDDSIMYNISQCNIPFLWC